MLQFQSRSTKFFVLLGMWGAIHCNLAAQTAFEAFPRLSDNTAGSANLEVRKVLHGHVDGMFVVNRSRHVIVAAGGYLWKFSDLGVLQDTLREQDRIFTSGVIFTPDHFVDWVFTGSAKRKPYGAMIDGSTLSHVEVLKLLARAQVVEFGKSGDRATVATSGPSAWAYLWSNGEARKLDLTRHVENVDTWCHSRTHSAEALRWNATCFKGYTRSTSPGWTEVEPQSFTGDGDSQPRVNVVKFERRRFHLEEGLGGQLLGATVGLALKAAGMRGELPGRYWFGDAHTRLRVGRDVVQFKAFVPKEDGEYRFMHNMRWWEPGGAGPGSSPWFTVHPRSYLNNPGELALLKHYEEDIGLYVVRPRGTGEVPETQRTVPAWRAVFEGPPTGSVEVRGAISFAQGQRSNAGEAVAPLPPTDLWLRPPLPSPRIDGLPPEVTVKPLWPVLRQVPGAITVRWRERGSTDDAGDTEAVLRVFLHPSEVQKAFSSVHGAGTNASRAAGAHNGAGAQDTLAELVLKLPPGAKGSTRIDPALADRLEVLVRAVPAPGKGRGQAVLVPLKQVKWEWIARPAPWVERPTQSLPTSQPAYLSLLPPLETTKLAAVPRGGRNLPAFLQQALALAQQPEHAPHLRALAPHITAAYADLLNRFNNLRQFEASATLVRHYLAQIHPHTSVYSDQDRDMIYNQGVIASQALAFSIHESQYSDLVTGVMSSLVGPAFDPQQQTNGTLMYNLSCYYAVAKDKRRLLESASVARRLGKPSAQFMEDKDFEAYWQDEEFLKTVR
ncbi:MAG: hypothetical protein EON54_01140 [Alcaligenaceae bacterium]|nr:MAG: hypothetical protein EON54_01140 [Alcaligenaceae bacterium]